MDLSNITMYMPEQACVLQSEPRQPFQPYSGTFMPCATGAIHANILSRIFTDLVNLPSS